MRSFITLLVLAMMALAPPMLSASPSTEASRERVVHYPDMGDMTARTAVHSTANLNIMMEVRCHEHLAVPIVDIGLEAPIRLTVLRDLPMNTGAGTFVAIGSDSRRYSRDL